MKRKIFAVLAAAMLMTACSSGYKDGSYEGKSSPDENGDYAEVSITVSNNAITSCDFKTYESNGELKDDEYAATSEEAAVAVASIPEYEKQLTSTGDIAQVESITGATINYNQLNEAVYDALSKAQ